MEFFRHHDMDAHKVLGTLLENSSNGCWIFFEASESTASGVSYVVTADVRDELVARLSSMLFRPNPQVETSKDEIKDVL